jgi:hypothetical protein
MLWAKHPFRRHLPADPSRVFHRVGIELGHSHELEHDSSSHESLTTSCRATPIGRRSISACMQRLMSNLSSGVVARLWRDQGKVGDARELLAPAYGGFTAGFGTPDLMVVTTLPDQPG